MTAEAQRQDPLERKKYVVRSSHDKFRVLEKIAEIECVESEPFTITVESAEAKRSTVQNSYYWGWVLRSIAKQLEDAGIGIDLDDGRHIPYDPDLLHEIFKDRYLAYDTYVFCGKERKKCWSTTVLRKSGKDEDADQAPDRPPTFGWYIRQIKQFVYECWEIHVPPTFNEDWRSLEQEMGR